MIKLRVSPYVDTDKVGYTASVYDDLTEAASMHYGVTAFDAITAAKAHVSGLSTTDVQKVASAADIVVPSKD